jgi:hypothetical protein
MIKTRREAKELLPKKMRKKLQRKVESRRCKRLSSLLPKKYR